MGIELRDKTYYLTTNAGISHCSQMGPCKEHLHDFIEFVYILRGKDQLKPFLPLGCV